MMSLLLQLRGVVLDGREAGGIVIGDGGGGGGAQV